MNQGSLKRLARIAAAAACALMLTATAGSGLHAEEIHIDVTRGRVDPLPIAIPPFGGGSPEEQQIGRDIATIVSADLERSGLFRPIDPRAFLQNNVDVNAQPKFADWRVSGSQALVVGNTTSQPDGRVRADFRLWDVFGETQLSAFGYAAQRSNTRRVAHIIADAIYKRLTGEDGYFDTRIVYIAETGPATRRIKRLAIMDQDGFNTKYLTSGQALVLTPRFSPSAQEITYLSYGTNRQQPRVYLFNIDTGQQEGLGEFPGMTFAPRFSPDGNRLVMSMAAEGQTEIYSMDLRTRRPTRLTDNPSINTSPSYSPDASQIVYNSDRGGSPQLYIMASGGGEGRRISFGNGKYSTPVWSPRGDLIAFTKQEGGTFSIGVMRPDGSGERILTSGYLVEGPTWAPNGRVLMFARQDGGRAGSRLRTIDLTGGNERELVTPTDASDPAWSPLIP